MREAPARLERRRRRTRRLRAFAVGVVAVAGLLTALLLGGSGAAAQPAVTLPPFQSCAVFHCVTVSVDPFSLNGSGQVTSDPAGISCTVVGAAKSGTCSTQMQFVVGASISINFTTTPAQGSLVCDSLYCSAKGAGSPAPSTETITVASSVSLVTKHSFGFTLAPEAVTVTKTGEGTGTVASDPTRLACGATCVESFDYGSTVKLIATPDAGASFTAWTGACAGQGATCSLTVTAPVSTNAVFRLATTSTTTTTSAATTTTSQPATTTTASTTITRTSAGVEAELLAVRSVRSKLGVRVAQVELNAGEPLTVTVSLMRRGAPLAGRTFVVRPGDRVLTLVLPGGLASGTFVLVVRVTNSSRHTRSFTRALRLTATAH